MNSEEMQRLWDQQMKPKLAEIMKPKLAEILCSTETLSDISRVFDECGILETEDVRIGFKLDIIKLEPNGNTEKLEVEISSLQSSFGGCVYYHNCPNGSGRPCAIC